MLNIWYDEIYVICNECEYRLGPFETMEDANVEVDMKNWTIKFTWSRSSGKSISTQFHLCKRCTQKGTFSFQFK